MRTAYYYELIENPFLLNKDSLEPLGNLVEQYPYVESFRILYALNMLLLDDHRYQDQLHKAALYASDRKKLKQWVDLLSLKEEEEEQDQGQKKESQLESNFPKDETQIVVAEEDKIETIATESPDPIILKESKEENVRAETETSVFELEKEGKLAHQQEVKRAKTKAELLKLVRQRLAEIEQEKKGQEISVSAPIDDDKTTKARLIERFIIENPSISRPDKTDFFNPQQEAIESSMDDDDYFVTETLAQIHTQQGNIQKAIEIYQKLILKNPEKSAYFAAQIENLSK